MVRRLGLSVVVAIFLADPACPAAQEGADRASQAKAAVEGYAENRASFRFMRCEYTQTDAKVATVEDALRGKNYRDPFVATNVFLLDGDDVMHRCDAPGAKDALKTAQKRHAGKSSATVSIPFAPSGYLANGTDSLGHGPLVSCANLSSPYEPLNVGVTLLCFGPGPSERRRGPDYHLDQCRAGRGVMWPEGLREVDGHPAVCVKFGDARGRPESRYALDVERGFLPLRTSLYDGAGREYMTFYLTHAIRLSRDRWFPERDVRVVPPGPGGGLFSVRETKVTKVEVVARPRKSEFTLRLDAGTRIIGPNFEGHFRLKRQEDVGLADLTTLKEKCRLAAEQPLMDTAVRPVDAYAWARRTGYAAAALLAVGLVVYTARRRSRPTKAV
jgi:hypothetical protein